MLQSLEMEKWYRHLSRYESLKHQSARGIGRWLRRGGFNRGLLAGFGWVVFCGWGFFPPPLWATPIYVWFAVVLNGWITARYREMDWQSPEAPAFLVWESHVNPDTLPQFLAKMKKDLIRWERDMQNFVSTSERIANLFSFADGTATTICIAAMGVLAVCTCIILLVVRCADPTGRWSCALVGFGLCLAVSTSKPPAQEEEDFVSAKFEDVNRMLRFVPDDYEMAHRYIATKVQCAAAESATTSTSTCSLGAHDSTSKHAATVEGP